MTTVCINPMPSWARRTRFRPLPAPIFPDGAPSREDAELAMALLDELDQASRAWYGLALVERLRLVCGRSSSSER